MGKIRNRKKEGEPTQFSDGDPVWQKLQDGSWWPGFVRKHGSRKLSVTFWGEESETSIAITETFTKRFTRNRMLESRMIGKFDSKLRDRFLGCVRKAEAVARNLKCRAILQGATAVVTSKRNRSAKETSDHTTKEGTGHQYRPAPLLNPVGGIPVWQKLEPGIWWPGYIYAKNDKKGVTFWGEEQDVLLPLTNNTTRTFQAHQLFIEKIMAKLKSHDLKDKFIRDVRRAQVIREKCPKNQVPIGSPEDITLRHDENDFDETSTSQCGFVDMCIDDKCHNHYETGKAITVLDKKSSINESGSQKLWDELPVLAFNRTVNNNRYYQSGTPRGTYVKSALEKSSLIPEKRGTTPGRVCSIDMHSRSHGVVHDATKIICNKDELNSKDLSVMDVDTIYCHEEDDLKHFDTKNHSSHQDNHSGDVSSSHTEQSPEWTTTAHRESSLSSEYSGSQTFQEALPDLSLNPTANNDRYRQSGTPRETYLNSPFDKSSLTPEKSGTIPKKVCSIDLHSRSHDVVHDATKIICNRDELNIKDLSVMDVDTIYCHEEDDLKHFDTKNHSSHQDNHSGDVSSSHTEQSPEWTTTAHRESSLSSEDSGSQTFQEALPDLSLHPTANNDRYRQSGAPRETYLNSPFDKSSLTPEKSGTIPKKVCSIDLHSRSHDVVHGATKIICNRDELNIKDLSIMDVDTIYCHEKDDVKHFDTKNHSSHQDNHSEEKISSSHTEQSPEWASTGDCEVSLSSEDSGSQKFQEALPDLSLNRTAHNDRYRQSVTCKGTYLNSPFDKSSLTPEESRTTPRRLCSVDMLSTSHDGIHDGTTITCNKDELNIKDLSVVDVDIIYCNEEDNVEHSDTKNHSSLEDNHSEEDVSLSHSWEWIPATDCETSLDDDASGSQTFREASPNPSLNQTEIIDKNEQMGTHRRTYLKSDFEKSSLTPGKRETTPRRVCTIDMHNRNHEVVDDGITLICKGKQVINDISVMDVDIIYWNEEDNVEHSDTNNHSSHQNNHSEENVSISRREQCQEGITTSDCKTSLGDNGYGSKTFQEVLPDLSLNQTVNNDQNELMVSTRGSYAKRAFGKSSCDTTHKRLCTINMPSLSYEPVPDGITIICNKDENDIKDRPVMDVDTLYSHEEVNDQESDNDSEEDIFLSYGGHSDAEMTSTNYEIKPVLQPTITDMPLDLTMHGDRYKQLDHSGETCASNAHQTLDTVKSCTKDPHFMQRMRRRMENVTIAIYKPRDGGKRNYSKKDYCVFCEGAFSASMRIHLINCHCHEPAVQEAMELPLHSKQRKHAFMLLRKEGNFRHNINVIKCGEGEIVVFRRPRENHKAFEYIPCEYCYAFVLHHLLYIHVKTCIRKPAETQPEVNYYRNGCAMLAPFLKSVSEKELTEDTIKLLDGLRETQKSPGIVNICRNDNLIREFAMSLVEKLGPEADRRIRDMDNARGKIRTLGKVLKKLNENDNEWHDLSYFLSGKGYKQLIAAVRAVSQERDSPQFALTAGHYLKQINLIKISIAIETENEAMKREGKNFKHMFEASWNAKISSVALRRQKLRQINREDVLPVTEDLLKFRKWLCSILAEKPDNPDQEIVTRIAKATLARLLVFNKLRIAEVEELKVFDFQNRPNDIVSDDIMKCLSISEKALAKHMRVVQVRGKSTRGIRKVHLIITPDAKEAIDYVIRHRATDNPYVFAHNSTKPMNGCRIMREMTAECPGLKRPHLIRSRHLRKYIATTTQINDMDSNELKMLADHLGHNLNVHTDVYCLQSSLIERTKVAQILLAVENGSMKKLAGQVLREIDSDNLPMPYSYDDDWESTNSDDNLANNADSAEPLCKDGTIMCSDPPNLFHPDGSSTKVHRESTIEHHNDSDKSVDPAYIPAESSESSDDTPIAIPKTQNTKPKTEKVRQRKSWTKEENNALWESFSAALKSGRNVKSTEIRAAKERFPCLKTRSDVCLRVKVNNIIMGKQQFEYMI